MIGFYINDVAIMESIERLLPTIVIGVLYLILMAYILWRYK